MGDLAHNLVSTCFKLQGVVTKLCSLSHFTSLRSLLMFCKHFFHQLFWFAQELLVWILFVAAQCYGIFGYKFNTIGILAKDQFPCVNTGPVPFLHLSVYPSFVPPLPLYICSSVCITSLTPPAPAFQTFKLTLLLVLQSGVECSFCISPSISVTDQACFLPVRFVSLYFVCNLTEISIRTHLYQLMWLSRFGFLQCLPYFYTQVCVFVSSFFMASSFTSLFWLKRPFIRYH